MKEQVWFKDSHGRERPLGRAGSWQQLNLIIDNFIAEANDKKKPDEPKFKRYYTRYWQQNDGRICLDVGSHTEFFLWENDI